MDTHGKIRKFISKEQGFVIVYVAIALIAIIAIAGLVIDIGYMYVVKGQLQNAADAASLAGAAKLDGTNDLSQNIAREEAKKFALKNIAGGKPVVLASNGSNELSDENDITVGNWNGTTYTPGGLPVNAIQVRARRTPSAPAGAVDIFLGRIIGWEKMSASAISIAARPAKVNLSIAVCIRSCNEIVIQPGKSVRLYWSPYPREIDPGYLGIGWTIFSETSQKTPTKELIEFFCGKELDACDKLVYSNNGFNNAAARQLRCAFKNPEYDRENKTFDSLGNVVSWTVLVPVFDDCPPGNQPKPYKVIKYARMRIKEVYASGGGGTNECACGAFNATMSDPNAPNAIEIDMIECDACPSQKFLGRRAVLVK